MSSNRIAAFLICVSLISFLSCNANTKYRTLKLFFDGVPEPKQKRAVPAGGTKAGITQVVRPQYFQHGPYAAKMCDSCHDRSGNRMLSAPVEELCFKCHEFQMTKRYIHGPLASGGCLICHNPHSSPNRYLLISQSSNFCFECHDARSLPNDQAHTTGGMKCTDCHDAHMSDKKYLLK